MDLYFEENTIFLGNKDTYTEVLDDNYEKVNDENRDSNDDISIEIVRKSLGSTRGAI